MTLRILHCIPTMDGGGSERQLSYLVREQVRQGLDIHVAIGRGGPNLARLQASGAVVHLLPLRSNQNPRRTADLVGLIRRVRPDLVQTWLLQMDFFGGLAARMSRVPWILAERSSVEVFHPAAKYSLRRFVARRATGVVSNSKGGDAYWQSKNGERVPRWIIPNSVPVEEIDRAQPQAPERADWLPGRGRILCPGRIHPIKNLVRLSEALGAVSARIPIQALICGTGLGSYARDCLGAIERLKLQDTVTLSEYRPDVWGLMKEANVLVSVSLGEGSPNSVLEGMAARCPVVLSDIPAHREIADEESAIFVDPLSVRDIADGVIRCLEGVPESRARAEAARNRALGLSVGEIARRYTAVYVRVLGGTGASDRGSDTSNEKAARG